jgi:hypothetical protein
MATLACTYTVDRFRRTPEQVVAALLREDTAPPPADRPEPRLQRYWGCFAEAGHDGADAVPSAYGAFAWVAEEATRRWRPGQPVIRLMDGQKSLWDAADACLEELEEKMQAHDPEQQFVDIADLLHVSHYVWRGAKVLYPHREQQEAFVEVCNRSSAIKLGKMEGGWECRLLCHIPQKPREVEVPQAPTRPCPHTEVVQRDSQEAGEEPPREAPVDTSRTATPGRKRTPLLPESRKRG